MTFIFSICIMTSSFLTFSPLCSPSHLSYAKDLASKEKDEEQVRHDLEFDVDGEERVERELKATRLMETLFTLIMENLQDLSLLQARCARRQRDETSLSTQTETVHPPSPLPLPPLICSRQLPLLLAMSQRMHTRRWCVMFLTRSLPPLTRTFLFTNG